MKIYYIIAFKRNTIKCRSCTTDLAMEYWREDDRISIRRHALDYSVHAGSRVSSITSWWLWEPFPLFFRGAGFHYSHHAKSIKYKRCSIRIHTISWSWGVTKFIKKGIIICVSEQQTNVLDQLTPSRMSPPLSCGTSQRARLRYPHQIAVWLFPLWQL